MKKLLVSLLLALAPYAFGAADAGTQFEGKGYSKSSTGQESNYSVNVSVVAVDHGMDINNTYTFSNSIYQWNYHLHNGTNNMFDVYSNNILIGNGYCMPIPDNGGKWCHYSIKLANVQLEQTTVIKDGHVYRLGSKYDVDTNTKYMWQESLAKVVPVPAPGPTPPPAPVPAPVPTSGPTPTAQ